MPRDVLQSLTIVERLELFRGEPGVLAPERDVRELDGGVGREIPFAARQRMVAGSFRE